MLGIRVPRRSYVFARFTALLHALFRAGVPLLFPHAALAGQVPPEPQAAETVDEAVTAVALTSSSGFLDGGGFLAPVVEAGPAAWFVLATLPFFSLVSWAIILHKSRRLGQVERSSAAFLNHFRSAKRFADVVACAPLSLKAIKRSVHDTAHLTVREARNTRLPSLAAALQSRDAEEGVLAFREKRAPVWTGR